MDRAVPVLQQEKKKLRLYIYVCMYVCMYVCSVESVIDKTFPQYSGPHHNHFRNEYFLQHPGYF